MKTVLIGVAAEAAAVAGSYIIFLRWHRMPLYALFYLPPVDYLIQPATAHLPTIGHLLFLAAVTLLFLANSCKWSACIKSLAIKKGK
jgi:hypothetical protein